jgi:transglutaminase-like putative cysteine protease
MRYEITYESTYHYSAPVVGNFNRLRMRPRTGGTQRCEHFDVSVTPRPDRRSTYDDLFGNEVTEVLVAAPLQRLRIQVDATVATTEPMPPPEGSWTDIQDDRYRLAAGPYRYHPYGYLHENQQIAGLVEEVRAGTPGETLVNVVRVVHERFRYEPGVTNSKTTTPEFVALGAGVCQDFAHLALALLRSHDVGARYVSGYFFTAPGDSNAASAEVQTHAWIEALLPVDGGGDPVWFATDPTNAIIAGADHVKIGHGRMYEDVSPVEGTFSGDADSTVDAHVTMHRVASPAVDLEIG